MNNVSIDTRTSRLLAHVDEQGIGWITFNNPGRHNAMSLTMWQALTDTLKQFAKLRELRVLILQGAGEKAFVSGADISEFGEKRSSRAQREAYELAFDTAQRSLADFDKPVVARIRGYCVGGGLALALNADIRLASTDSRFGIPAARLSVGYGYESVKTLVSVVGPANAKDILFSGRMLSSEEALRTGLVNRVFENDQFDMSVIDYVNTLASNAPLTIMSVKAAVREIVRDPGQVGPAYCEQLVEDCFTSADYKEGQQAFLEKRKPKFIGA